MTAPARSVANGIIIVSIFFFLSVVGGKIKKNPDTLTIFSLAVGA